MLSSSSSSNHNTPIISLFYFFSCTHMPISFFPLILIHSFSFSRPWKFRKVCTFFRFYYYDYAFSCEKKTGKRKANYTYVFNHKFCVKESFLLFFEMGGGGGGGFSQIAVWKQREKRGNICGESNLMCDGWWVVVVVFSLVSEIVSLCYSTVFTFIGDCEKLNPTLFFFVCERESWNVLALKGNRERGWCRLCRYLNFFFFFVGCFFFWNWCLHEIVGWWWGIGGFWGR